MCFTDLKIETIYSFGLIFPMYKMEKTIMLATVQAVVRKVMHENCSTIMIVANIH